MIPLHRAPTTLALAALLVSAGCIGLPGEADDPADIDPAEADLEQDAANITETPSLNHTLETVELSWSQVHLRPPMAPAQASEPVWTNCVFVDGNRTVVDDGQVTVNWEPSEITTSRYTVVELKTSDFERYEAHRLWAPLHAGEDYTVAIDGWNLTNDIPGGDLLIALEPAEQAYATIESQATVTLDLHHTGTIEDIYPGTCT